MIDTKRFRTSENAKGFILEQYLGNEEHVVIPREYKVIRQRAFQKCASIKTVTFSEGTETIEHEAFRECPNLTEVHLPDSLKTMEYAAFLCCGKLERICFGKKLKALEASVLYRCNGIQKLVIPETIQKVDREGGINGLDGLTSLIIESDLPKNKAVAIIDCQNLTEVVYKKGFANLKGLTFVCCPKLEQVTVGNETYKIKVKDRVGTIVQEEKKLPTGNGDPVEFRYNKELGQFECDYKDILFVTEQEPDKEAENNVIILAEGYLSHLDKIVKFVLPEIKELYGKTTAKEVKSKLGKPRIDLDRWQVTYLEQSFDGMHIFGFEFMDEEFEDIGNFSIDG